MRLFLTDLIDEVKAIGQWAAGIAATALGCVAVIWIGGRPVVVVALILAVVVCLVVLVRGVIRTPNYISESERQHVREPGTLEGVILPEKRLPRG